MDSDCDPVQVFVLVVIHNEKKQGRLLARPVVFESLIKLHQHLADLVARDIDKYEQRFSVPLLKFRKDGEFEKFVRLWAHAKNENAIPLSFDALWDERPQVVL
jgi:hypothetical protein